MRLKSWESPRAQGRNNKGKGGSARQRQIKKRNKMIKKRLRGESPLFFYVKCDKTQDKINNCQQFITPLSYIKLELKII